MSKVFEDFKVFLKKAENYAHVCKLLSWDMETTMPKEGFAGHSDALTYFQRRLLR